MKIIITRASDSSKKVKYDPEEVEKVDLKDIVKRYGRCQFGEVIYVLDATANLEDPDKAILHHLFYDASHNDYFEVLGYQYFKRI